MSPRIVEVFVEQWGIVGPVWAVWEWHRIGHTILLVVGQQLQIWSKEAVREIDPRDVICTDRSCGYRPEDIDDPSVVSTLLCSW